MRAGLDGRAYSRLGFAIRERGVLDCADFRRIDAISRRSHPDIDPAELTRFLRARGGTWELRPDQAYALADAVDQRGLFCPLPVGEGKAIISLLLPVVLRAERPLLLVPAALRDATVKSVIPTVGRHFRLHPNLMLLSHEEISTVAGKDRLRERRPDLVIVDEAQGFRNRKSARGIRFERFAAESPDCLFAFLSGSFSTDSIEDYAHLLRLALRHSAHGAPVPTTDAALATWADAVDAGLDDERRMAPGALWKWTGQTKGPSLFDSDTRLALTQGAFGRRLAETPGVVCSSAAPLAIPIHVREVRPAVPVIVVDAFRRLRSEWETPQDDQIADAMHLWRIVRQLACGFYYRWKWPGGVVDRDWVDRRKDWHRFVRRTITTNAVELDSLRAVESACKAWEHYLLLRDAGARNESAQYRASTHLIDSQEYRDWLAVRDRFDPEEHKETVWLSTYLVDFANDWLESNVGICWVDHSAFGHELRKRGIRYYGAADNDIIYETVSCAASIHAHREGKNLQAFARNLIVTPPTNGTRWEQLIGRTHRPGQSASDVTVDVCLHVREYWQALDRSRLHAAYNHAQGRHQRLCLPSTSIEVRSETDALTLSLDGNPLWAKSDTSLDKVPTS